MPVQLSTRQAPSYPPAGTGRPWPTAHHAEAAQFWRAGRSRAGGGRYAPSCWELCPWPSQQGPWCSQEASAVLGPHDRQGWSPGLQAWSQRSPVATDLPESRRDGCTWGHLKREGGSAGSIQAEGHEAGHRASWPGRTAVLHPASAVTRPVEAATGLQGWGRRPHRRPSSNPLCNRVADQGTGHAGPAQGPSLGLSTGCPHPSP